MDTCDDVVRVIMDLAVAGFIEGLDSVKVEGGAKRLVEKLDGGNDVGIALIAGRKSLDSIDGLLDSVALLPLYRAVATGVVEAIL